MKIYISGPISGRPLEDARAEFAAAAADVESRGHEAVNPCDIQKILKPETTSWEQYMEISLALLHVSDGILLLRNWRKSKGACAEFWDAFTGEKQIFYSTEEIPEPEGDMGTT